MTCRIESGLVPLVLFATLAACSSGGLEPRATASNARPVDPEPARTPSSPDAIDGTVVNEKQRPLAGRVVAIGDERTTTDVAGRFALAGVGANYDVIVAEPNGSRATVYRGLTRRDPRLVHVAEEWAPRPAHRATLVGRVDGGPFSRTDWVDLTFTSKWTSGQIFLGGTTGMPLGPEYGPFAISWNGPDTIAGDLVAVRTQQGPAAAGAGATRDLTGRSSWLAMQAVTLQDGQTATVNLTPAMLPRLQTRVTVDAPGAYATQVGEVFVFPPSRAIAVAGGLQPRPRDTAYDLDILDARGAGGSLCASASYGYGQWRFARSCGLPVDAPPALVLRRPPALQRPAPSASLRPDTAFSWSTVEGAIYELELRDNATASAPAIDVFTTETTSTWPDLRALGVGFPTGSAVYGVKIAARGPYATMDDAVGPEGVGAPFPEEYWLSESLPVKLVVEPPETVDPAALQCQFPAGKAVVCDPPSPNDPEGTPEYYVLSAINNKLRHFPQFADAVGIHCVRDCDGARAFVKAYADYGRTHPGFDSNEPVELLPPPPRP